MTSEEIFEKMKKILVEEFEIEEEIVTMDASIGDDLDFDSIDAIDLLAKLREYAPEGKARLDPVEFRTVKTLGDVVTLIQKAWG